MTELFLILIFGKITIMHSGIPPIYQVIDSLLYVWNPYGELYIVDPIKDTYKKADFPDVRRRYVLSRNGKHYFYNKKLKKILILDARGKRSLQLSKNMIYGDNFRIFGRNIYFILYGDSMMFEVLNTDNDSLWFFLKRDAEDSIISTFSINKDGIFIYNPITGKLKVYSLSGVKIREFAIPEPDSGMWGLFKDGASVIYYGGVAEIVSLDDGRILVSCFQYRDRKSIWPRTFLISLPDSRILKTFDGVVFLAGKIQNFLIYLSFKRKNWGIEIWKEKLSN